VSYNRRRSRTSSALADDFLPRSGFPLSSPIPVPSQHTVAPPTTIHLSTQSRAALTSKSWKPCLPHVALSGPFCVFWMWKFSWSVRSGCFTRKKWGLTLCMVGKSMKTTRFKAEWLTITGPHHRIVFMFPTKTSTSMSELNCKQRPSSHLKRKNPLIYAQTTHLTGLPSSVCHVSTNTHKR
jgi:hypothetical protein